MKSSDAKLAANRANAQKSTGPRSDEGKARSSQNAITHGVLSRQTLLLPGEDPDEWAAFREGLVDYFAPEGALEQSNVERIVDLMWRIRRVALAEAGFLRAEIYGAAERCLRLDRCLDAYDSQSLADQARNVYLPKVPSRAPERSEELFAARDQDDNNVGRAVAANIDVVMKFSRYEGRLDGFLHKSVTELAGLQEARRQRTARAELATARIIDAALESGATPMAPNEATVALDVVPESGAAPMAPNEATIALDAAPESDAVPIVPNETTVALDVVPESGAAPMAPNEATIALDVAPE